MPPVHLKQDEKDQENGATTCVHTHTVRAHGIDRTCVRCHDPAAFFFLMWLVINCCDISPL